MRRLVALQARARRPRLGSNAVSGESTFGARALDSRRWSKRRWTNVAPSTRVHPCLHGTARHGRSCLLRRSVPSLSPSALAGLRGRILILAAWIFVVAARNSSNRLVHHAAEKPRVWSRRPVEIEALASAACWICDRG